MEFRSPGSPHTREFLPRTVPTVETVALTSLARAGGCAAKYSAARLETLLAGIVPADSEDLLVGLDPADDAAVYRLDDERAIVFTVDFFPPLVDDPRTFGAIAATNALNDVFAMGGKPLLALSVAAFPEELPVEVLGDVLAGADERVRAVRCDPRRRPHDSRHRAEIRSRSRRDRPSRPHLAESRSAARRRARAHEASRDRDRPAGASRRRGAGRCARRRGPVDARAEHGRGRRDYGRSSRTRSPM